MKHPRLLRLLCLALALCLLAPLAACSKYRVEMSNEKESRTVMQLDGYDVPFEVLSFFYHNKPEAATHEEKLAAAIRDVCELYAVFSVTRACGIDPFGEELNARLDSAVREMIDSFETRREYIDSLARRHMTDNTCRLLLRSYLCEARLLESDMQDRLEDELLSFCASDEVLRVMGLAVYYEDPSLEAWARDRADTILGMLALAPNTDEAFEEIAGSEASFEGHNYMSLAQLRTLTGKGEDFTPALGYVSDALFDSGSFVILRVTEKDLSYVASHIAQVMPAYIDHLIAEATSPIASPLIPLSAADFTG